MATTEVTLESGLALSNLTAPAKLRLLAQVQKEADNDLGLGYSTAFPKGPHVIIKDLEGKSFVALPTRNSRRQFDQVIEEFIPISEFRFTLFHCARAYSAREAIMFEGGTAIGKTYAVSSMGNLLYGPNTVLPEVYCHAMTDVSELMGKPVPAALSNSQLAALNEFLNSEDGQKMRAEMLQEEGKINTAELTLRVAQRLGFPAQKGSFRLQLGKLPQAMSGDIASDGSFLELKDGPGVPFHLQELGAAPPLVTNSLLRTRGTKGRLAERVQLSELDGVVVTAGQSFGLIMSTNPAGQEFKDRFPVDPANSRGLVWIRLPDTLQINSLKKAAANIFSFERVERDADAPQAILDLRRYPELGDVLGTVMALFHEQYTQNQGRGEGSRKQKIPVTMDHMWKVARYLQHHQQVSADGGSVDLRATLEAAIECHYINLLESKRDRIAEHASKNSTTSTSSTGQTLLNHLQQTLENPNSGTVKLNNGAVVKFGEAIDVLTQEAWNKELALESSEEKASGQALAEAKAEIARIHVILANMKGKLDDRQFSSFIAQFKEKASPEALTAIESWLESEV